MLGHQGMKQIGEEADRFFALAASKFEAALEVKPDLEAALIGWAAALTQQARMKTGPDAKRFFALSGEKLEAARRLGSNRVYYNLACLHALIGDHEEARENLELAKNYGTLPSKAYIEADEDLASIRKEPWFQEFLISLDDSSPSG